MDLDDLVACCEAEDGSDVELTLDEFEPQCAEDVTNDHTERVTPEDRQLVLAGKAPHFQKSFLQSLQSVINIRLQELRDGKVILQFSANFERIQTNERFQVIINVTTPSFSKLY